MLDNLSMRCTSVRPSLLALALVACSHPVADYCDEATPCDDPAKPFCDLNGQHEGSDFISNTCIPYPWDAGGADVDAPIGTVDAGPDALPAACVADSTTCEDATLIECGSDGTVRTSTECALGCHGTEVRCNDLAPSNALAAQLDLASSAPDVVFPDGTTINTTNGTVVGPAGQISVPTSLIAAPGGGVELRVLRLHSLVVGDTVIEGGPALAIVSDGDVVITGDITASRTMPPGVVASCPASAVNLAVDSSVGAGGGGFGTAGGRGGSWGGALGKAGGGVAGNDALEPLRGGCAGGRWYSDDGSIISIYRLGGVGRAAMQISSRTRIQLGDMATAAVGTIRMTGSAPALNSPFGGGAGGGSGGAVLLEAPAIAIAAGSGVTANGGSGVCGANPGTDGQFGTARATGEVCGAVTGGSGASLAGGATNGGNAPAQGGVYGGGGGGGAGRIRINTANGSFTIAAGGVVSPAASTGSVAVR